MLRDSIMVSCGMIILLGGMISGMIIMLCGMNIMSKQFVFANIYKEQFFLFAKVVKMTITL